MPRQIDYNMVDVSQYSNYKQKTIDNLRMASKESLVTFLDKTSSVSIDVANPTTSTTTNPLKISYDAANQATNNRKTLLKFDVSSLTGKTVKKAFLRLIAANQSNEVINNTFLVKAVLREWDATATWNNYAGENAWGTAGAVGAADVDSSAIESVSIKTVAEWDTIWIDITAIVQAWIANTYANNGIIVYGGSTIVTNIMITSFATGVAPCLVVEYTDSPQICAMTPAKKAQTALNFLGRNHTASMFSWKSGGIVNALANADDLGWNPQYRTALVAYFNNYNTALVSLYYFHTGGQALIKLYKNTNTAAYLTQLQAMRASYSTMTQTDGIYTKEGILQTELGYCGLGFLADYGDAFDDATSTNMAIEQAILLYDKMMLGQSDGVPLTVAGNATSKGWGRGVGWMYAGMGKVLKSPAIQAHASYPSLVSKFRTLSAKLKELQQSDGLWCSCIHQPTYFHETSATALFVIGMELGLQTGILDDSYYEVESKAVDGLYANTDTGAELKNVFIFGTQDHTGQNTHVNDIGWGLFVEALTLIASR